MQLYIGREAAIEYCIYNSCKSKTRYMKMHIIIQINVGGVLGIGQHGIEGSFELREGWATPVVCLPALLHDFIAE